MNGQSSVYIYYINLDSGRASKAGDTGGVCTSAAVCQSKKDDSFFRNIGESSQKLFFMQGNNILHFNPLPPINPFVHKAGASDHLKHVKLDFDKQS